MARLFDSETDAGLRRLIGDLLDIIEGTARLTPYERLDRLDCAREDAALDAVGYDREPDDDPALP